MQDEEIRALLRKRPFEPFDMCLSDGRSVWVRHPDQVVITKRNVFIGLARIKRRQRRLSTPGDDYDIAKDWMFVDLIHIVGAEPVDGPSARRNRRKPKQ